MVAQYWLCSNFCLIKVVFSAYFGRHCGNPALYHHQASWVEVVYLCRYQRDSNNVKLCTWNLVSIILRWRLIVPRGRPMYTTRGTGTLWCLVCAAFNRIENRFRKEYVKNSSSLRRMFLRIIALCLCEFRWVFQFETSLCGIHMSPLLLTWLCWILVTGQWPKNICVKHQDHISPLWYLCIDICKSLIVLRRWRKNVNLPWSLWRMTHPRLLRANI